MEFGFLHLAAIFVATVVGETFGTLFGGGSFFIQPALLAAGIPANMAVANDVTAAVFSNLAFLWFYRKDSKKVDYRPFRPALLWMAPALVAGAVIGGHILNYLPQQALTWIIVVICGCGFVYTLLHMGRTTKAIHPARRGARPYWQLGALAAGLGVGMYDGMSGAGSGILLILALTTVFRMDMKDVLALANMLSAISLFTAGVTFWYLGLLSVTLLGVMVPACLLAGMAGAKIANVLPEQVLRMVYAVLVLMLMSYLVFTLLRAA